MAVAPDGWREVVEPESGTRYFFNDATEQSQWERPAELGGARGFSAIPNSFRIDRATQLESDCSKFC